MPRSLVLVILAVYLLLSVITIGALAVDKRAAIAGRRRVPERSLHMLELLGGWPGSLIAQRRLHHKTRKRSYQIVVIAIIALHVLGWIAVGAWMLRK